MEARDIEALTQGLNRQNDDLRRGLTPRGADVSALTDALEQGLAHHRGMLPATLVRAVRALSRAARENRALLAAVSAGARAAAGNAAYDADGQVVGASLSADHDRKV